MTMKKNILWLAVALLTAFAGVSCSNVDDLSEVPTPNPSKEVAENIVTFTAMLDAKGGSGMRAVSASGATTWVENEEILISYENTSSASVSAKATVESVDANGKATITASLVNPKDGCQINFYYPYESWKSTSPIDFYYGQDGSLSTLSQYFDHAVDDSQNGEAPYYLSVSGGVATLPSSINMVNPNIIWKLSFTDGVNDITSDITKLEIYTKAGPNTFEYTITPTALTTVFYVAMGPPDDIVFTAYTPSGMYRRAKNGINLEMGKIYTTTGLAMNKVELGKVIGADGNIYANAGAATTAGTSAVAVISYFGSAGSVDASSTTYRGLAVAMSDANSGNKCQWKSNNDDNCTSRSNNITVARNYLNGIASTNTLTSAGHSGHDHNAAVAAVSNNGTAAPGGTSGWFLPSIGQWGLILQGLAEKSTPLTTSLNSEYEVSIVNTKIIAAGGTGLQAYAYWSSTECDVVTTWAIHFSLGSGDAGDNTKASQFYVRSALAF